MSTINHITYPTCDVKEIKKESFKADLSNQDLSNVSFVTYELSSIDFSNTNLSNCSGLIFAKLNDSNLENANLTNVDLYRADLRGANLKGTNLTGTNLYGAWLDNTIARKVEDVIYEIYPTYVIGDYISLGRHTYHKDDWNNFTEEDFARMTFSDKLNKSQNKCLAEHLMNFWNEHKDVILK